MRPPVRFRFQAIPAAAFLAGLLFFGTPVLRADFEDLGAGARAMGLGGAFVGLADDSRAVYYNPAGLAGLGRNEVSADYGRLHVKLEDGSNLSTGYFSMGVRLIRRKSFDERVRDLRKLSAEESQVPVSIASAAVTARELEKRSDPVTFFKDVGTAGFGLSNTSLSGALSQNTFLLSYGRKLHRRIAGGLSLKVLHKSYTLDSYTVKDPVFDHGAKSGLLAATADAGLRFNIAPKIFLGIAVGNLNRPNIALNPAGKENLSRTFKAGFALKEKMLNMATDAWVWNGNYQLRAGAERWFRNRSLALRLGGGFGSRDFKNVTSGFSVNWGNTQIDYAIVYPVSGIKGAYGSHKISFTYRFGKSPLNELEEGSVELYYAKLKDEMELLKARLDKTEDERSRLEKVLVQEALSRIHEKVRAEKLEASISPSRKDAPAPRPVPFSAAKMKTYVTTRGDTLQSIAEAVYGKKERWPEIYNLNKENVGRGGSVKAGTVLLIPGIGTESAGDRTEAAPAEDVGRTLAPIVPGRPKAGETGMTLAPLPQRPEERPRTGPKKPPEPGFYTVQKGDTLTSIAQKVYGDSKRWKEIYNANKDKMEKGLAKPGAVLTIPRN
ncbi:MAG: hypothetical protein A2636_03510 [Elusimicrobia bacterium RIFCSPHIGHO2_01_FULL_64_10]|nr:MAG: hypothetical protein A2636_03510 [Elusimicrobia bacterium RIFCSPHIGHO2_01_FULL_64_10]